MADKEINPVPSEFITMLPRLPPVAEATAAALPAAILTSMAEAVAAFPFHQSVIKCPNETPDTGKRRQLRKGTMRSTLTHGASRPRREPGPSLC